MNSNVANYQTHTGKGFSTHLAGNYSDLGLIPPIIPFLKYLKSKKLVNAYIAVDISQEILDTVEANFAKAGLDIPVHKVMADFDVSLPFDEFSSFLSS